MSITRRGFVIAMPFAAAGCVTREPPRDPVAGPDIDPSHLSMYAAVATEPFPVPAIDLTEVRPEFLRREVAYRTREQPGTVVVDPAARYAYLVMEGAGRCATASAWAGRRPSTSGARRSSPARRNGRAGGRRPT